MRRLMLLGTLMLAVTGCATHVGAPLARTHAADAIGARSISQIAALAGTAEDLAAERAGETSDTWTSASNLLGFLPAGYEAADAPNQPAPTKLVRFAKIDDRLYRGSLPSLADLQHLKGLGIKTDIDLMGEIPVYDTFHVAREKRWAKKVGLKFVQIKVPTGKVPLVGPLTDEIATRFLQTVMDPANQPAYVHCVHGRDRTGTMAAVYRMAQHGFTNDQAMAEMKSFGFDEKDYPKLAAFVKAYKAKK